MKNKRIAEILRFLFVGGVCFFIDYFLLYAFTEYCGVSYLTSSGLSFTISFMVNYFLCIGWVFSEAKKQNVKQGIVFIGSSVAGLGINQICMWGFVEFLAMHYMVAKIFAAAIVMVWNYILKRRAVQM